MIVNVFLNRQKFLFSFYILGVFAFSLLCFIMFHFDHWFFYMRIIFDEKISKKKK